MTEEIIIDGVNVAGCIYYKQECIANCGMFALGDFKCEGQICLYKQLKRLEQENKELKAENEKLKAQLDVLEEDNKKLSKENDALYNNSLQEVKEDLVKRVWNLQTENKELTHYLACMTEQRNNYRSALEEIREELCKGRTFYEGYFDSENLSRTDKAIKKINEVLG